MHKFFKLILPLENLPVDKTDDQIKVNKGGRACGMYEGQNKCIK